MKNKSVQFLTYSAIIAAVYAVLTLLPPMSTFAYKEIQFRVSEALVAFCLFTPAGVWGVTLGCFISNFLNPNSFGPVDWFFGTGATFLATLLTYTFRKFFARNIWLMPLPTVIINALVVGSYLPMFITDSPYSAWMFISFVAIGEAVVCYLLGIPLAKIIKKRNILG